MTGITRRPVQYELLDDLWPKVKSASSFPALLHSMWSLHIPASVSALGGWLIWNLTCDSLMVRLEEDPSQRCCKWWVFCHHWISGPFLQWFLWCFHLFLSVTYIYICLRLKIPEEQVSYWSLAFLMLITTKWVMIMALLTCQSVFKNVSIPVWEIALFVILQWLI